MCVYTLKNKIIFTITFLNRDRGWRKMDSPSVPFLVSSLIWELSTNFRSLKNEKKLKQSLKIKERDPKAETSKPCVPC